MPREPLTPEPASKSEPFMRLADMPARDRHGVRTSTYEDSLGRLIRRTIEPVGLDAAALAEVHRRLQSQQKSLWLAWPRLRWVCVAFGIVFVSSGVVAGTRLWTSPSLHQAHDLPVAGKPHQKLTGRVPLAHTPDIVQVVPALPSPPTPLARRTPRVPKKKPPVLAVAEGARNTSPAAPAQPIASRPPSALAEEAASLSRALVSLRQNKDPQAALTQLDEHDQRFPTGALTAEALRLRVDALLRAKQFTQAEALLRAAPLAGAGRDVELKVIRAEMAAKRDCGEAILRFKEVLPAQMQPPLLERTLWGYAACLTQMDDEPATQRALKDYLARFPNGAHAVAAAARLRVQKN